MSLPLPPITCNEHQHHETRGKHSHGSTAVWKSAYVDEFVRQFERRRLKAHVATGRRAEHESEVDVDEVPIRVEQNVAVVSTTVKPIKSTPT